MNTYQQHFLVFFDVHIWYHVFITTRRITICKWDCTREFIFSYHNATVRDVNNVRWWKPTTFLAPDEHIFKCFKINL